jgi:hypothetical protein
LNDFALNQKTFKSDGWNVMVQQVSTHHYTLNLTSGESKLVVDVSLTPESENHQEIFSVIRHKLTQKIRDEEKPTEVNIALEKVVEMAKKALKTIFMHNLAVVPFQ